MFNNAEEWGGLSLSASPCHGIRLNKLGKHECLLSDTELAQIGKALLGEERKAPMAAAAIRRIALTGCRKSEICNLTWSEVRGRRLLLHDAKTGPRTVWLGQEAQTILAGMPRNPSSDRVFFNAGHRLTMASLNGCYLRSRKVAGLGHVRLHDLRHSFASRAASMSETSPIIAKLLGHTNIKMTARYAHLDDLSVMQVCERIGKLLASIASTQ